MSAALSQKLRDAVQSLRRTPKPIAEIAPLLQQAADRIDELEAPQAQGSLPDALTVGATMANVMFNMAQKPCHILTREECALFDKLRKEWDTAIRAQQYTVSDAAWPAEPTPEMQAAGACAIRFDTTLVNKMWTANAVYRAMRAAIQAQAGDAT